MAAAIFVFLLVLSLAVGLPPPSSRESHSLAAYHDLISRVGPSYRWLPSTVRDFLERASFSADALAIFEAQSVDGSILLDLDDATLERMGLRPVDMRRYSLLIAALADDFDDEAISQRDLFEIRAFYRAEFFSLAFALSLSPLAALGLIHAEQRAWDDLFLGASSASLFDLRTALLAPSWALWLYVRPFSEKNPWLASLLFVVLAAHQLLHALRLCYCALFWLGGGPHGHARAARDLGYLYIIDPLCVLLAAAAFRYLVFPLAPRAILDATFMLWLAAGPLLPLYTIYADSEAARAALVASPGAAALAACSRWVRVSRGSARPPLAPARRGSDSTALPASETDSRVRNGSAETKKSD